MKKLILALTIACLALFGAGSAQAQATLTSTTLSAAVADTSTTTITVASATGFSVNRLVYVDGEAMTITGVSGTVISVARGASGTKATKHASGATVYVGPQHEFIAKDLSGSCTAGSESPNVAPLINISNGTFYECISGVWRAVVQGTTYAVVEGATANAFETLLVVTEPTADRTITLPDQTGNLVLALASVITLTNVDLDTTDNSIAAHVCEDQSVTAAGVAATDNLIVTMTTTDLSVVFSIGAVVPGTGAVTFRTCNNSAAGADPGAVADFRIIRIATP